LLTVPQPTEWQHIGNQIEVAFVFARAHFIDVHRDGSYHFLVAVWSAKAAESWKKLTSGCYEHENGVSHVHSGDLVLHRAGVACAATRRRLWQHPVQHL